MSKQKKLKILLIDDDPTISEIIVQKLTMSGHEAIHVGDPKESLFQAQQVMPDVIILDLMMTRLSGEDALAILKRDETTADIPVLVFSNKGTEQDVSEELAELGADKYLVKADTSLEELVTAVEAVAKGG